MNLKVIAQSLIRGDAEAVSRLTRDALDAGMSADVVLEKGLLAGMNVVGMKFKHNEIFVPEVLLAARAMKAGMAQLETILKACGIEPVGKFVIGTVKGDIHDIGKNLVGMMLQGAGFEVIDLGINVSAQKFAEALHVHRPHLLGMSALLTTTMTQMKINIQTLREAGLLNETKVMVGGAPVTQGYADEIGADAYGKDAAEAAEKALALIQSRKAR